MYRNHVFLSHLKMESKHSQESFALKNNNLIIKINQKSKLSQENEWREYCDQKIRKNSENTSIS